MSIIDKVKDIFDGKPEIKHEDGVYSVGVAGTDYRASSLEDLEAELRREMSSRAEAAGNKPFNVARIETQMVSTSDIAEGQMTDIPDFEAALAAVQEERARQGVEIQGTESDPSIEDEDR